MFLRKTPRKKDGKTHDYWSVVENKRVAGGRVVQRHVLYLGEINSSQAAVWRKAIEVLDADTGRPRTMALFPEDRCVAAASDTSVVQLRRRTCGPVGRGSGAPVGWRGSCGRRCSWTPAAEPQRHAMGPGPAGIGLVPADRAGQRVEAAPRLVRQERHGRPAGGGLWTGGVAQAVRLP